MRQHRPRTSEAPRGRPLEGDPGAPGGLRGEADEILRRTQRIAHADAVAVADVARLSWDIEALQRRIEHALGDPDAAALLDVVAARSRIRRALLLTLELLHDAAGPPRAAGTPRGWGT